LKVLLVSGNRESSPEPPFPLGCAYLASAMREHGHEVACLDLLFEKDPGSALEGAISDARPDVIGLGMRNLDLLTFPEVHSEVGSYAGYVERIRSMTGAPVVLGGSGFSLAPREILAAVGGDVGIAGEGEVALPALIAAIRLAGGKVPADMMGSVLGSPPGVDIDLIHPDYDSFDVARYYSEGGGGTVQTRRGCNLGCTYCTYPLLEGRRLRMRSPEGVAGEMALLRDRYGIEHVTIVDSVLNHPESHAMGVAAALARLDPQVRWTAYFHPAMRDPGFLGAMRESGCEGLDVGADSLSDPVLERMGKGVTAREVIAFSDACRTAGLRFNLSLLFGAPGETPATLEETIANVGRCDPDSMTASIGVRLYPGAPICDDLVREGLVDASAVGIETLYYLSEPVRDVLVERLEEASRADKRWIIPGLGVNYNPRFFRRLRRHGRRGPIWHLVGE